MCEKKNEDLKRAILKTLYFDQMSAINRYFFITLTYLILLPDHNAVLCKSRLVGSYSEEDE